MNPLKAEVKILTLESVGREMEEMAEGADRQATLQRGAIDALKHAAKKLGSLIEHVDKEMDDGVIEALKGDPIAIAKYAKQYVRRCIGAIDNLATTAEVVGHMQEGRKRGLDEAAKKVNDEWKAEKEKLEVFAKAVQEGTLDDGSGDVRLPKGHPGPSLKSQRLAEDQGNGEPEKTPEEPPEKQPKGKPKGKKKPTAKKQATAKSKAKSGAKKLKG